MATNHTENYNLNLWEPNDSFIREEFNQDNAKIDAALACHPSAELLWSATVEETEEPVHNLKFDLSNVDWSRYIALILKVESPSIHGFRISLGSGLERCTHCYGHSSQISTDNLLARLYEAAHMTLIIPVLYSGQHRPTAIAFGSNESPTASTNSHAQFSAGGGMSLLNECNMLTVGCDTKNYTPGDWVVLWGIK